MGARQIYIIFVTDGPSRPGTNYVVPITETKHFPFMYALQINYSTLLHLYGLLRFCGGRGGGGICILRLSTVTWVQDEYNIILMFQMARYQVHVCAGTHY